LVSINERGAAGETGDAVVARLFGRMVKLGRIGVLPDAETFAIQLEKAVERSRNGGGRVIDITPAKDPE
jgi:hypothetical protein